MPGDQEPAAEVELDAEAVPEPEAGDEPVEAEAVAAEGEDMPTAAEAEAVAAESEPALPDRLAILEEDEQTPTFDGEPIKDSIGWLPVEPEEDYYSGWSTEEEAEKEPDFEWVRDDLFQEEAPTEYRRPSGKKKPKKRPRPSREAAKAPPSGSRDNRGGRSRSR